MEKLLAMNAAATLAAAVISNLEDNLTIDVDIKDENLRAENLMTWELFRIFYHGIVAAAKDDEHWPAPPARSIPGDIGAAAINLLRDNPSLIEIGRDWLQSLLGDVIRPASPQQRRADGV